MITIKKALTSIFLSIILIFSLVSPSLTVSAATTEYSGVMDDLSSDPNFDASAYPHKEKDYSLQVIQIAESANDELFIYVYQPSSPTKFLVASSVVLCSEAELNEGNSSDFSLSLLSSNGVFQKYKVNDFTVTDDTVRYYNISQIYRPFDSTIDTAPTDDNTITHKAYPVGQLWKAITNAGGVSYECNYVDLIKVTQKHVGFIRYVGGIFSLKDCADSHYVAFDTDHQIDELLEVDIIYNIESVTITPDDAWGGITTKKNVVTDKIEDTLYREEVLEGNTSGLFPESYKYNRIQSIDVFLKNEGDDLLGVTKEDIDGMKWVLRFYESAYIDTLRSSTSETLTTFTGMTSYTNVTEVAMLRMEFIYDGEIYNLGVVDDKQSGDTNPDNKTGVEFEDWWQKLVAIILGGFLVLMLWQFVPALVIKFAEIIFQVVIFILKILLSIATFPIRLIFKQKR